MLDAIKKISPKNPWHYLWIAVVFSVIITASSTAILSLIIFGRIPGDIFLISFLDGIIVPAVVAPVVVGLLISQRKQIENELRTLSLTDELTGLNNRRGFFILAEQELRLSNRTKKGIFILYADIDNFKLINDTFGHVEGDKVLIEIANLIKKNYRDSDIIGRMGGDEFVAIPVATSTDKIDIITARFNKILETYNKTTKRNYTVSISTGLAFYNPESPCLLDELLIKADKLMYEEKMRKKNLN
jgi:diguanylate cyclase (GGDEF)-like protein